MKRSAALLVALAVAAGFLVLVAGSARGDIGDTLTGGDDQEAPFDGTFDYKDMLATNAVTQCPHAGQPSDHQPQPLDIGQKDKVEQVSNGGDDIRVNQDYSCFPQDETSMFVNPTNQRNILGGANDYRIGTGSSGFYASTDNGQHWYDGILPFPTTSSTGPANGNGFLISGGDPAVVYDRGGTAYYAQLAFNRYNDTSGVFVARSLNGGFTWSRPCVPINGTTGANATTDAGAICGGNGDPRQPGDGVVNYTPDNDTLANSSVPFNDKEYIAAGPRPAGVTPTCFTPVQHLPVAPGSPGCPSDSIGPDRLYVTWSYFNTAGCGRGIAAQCNVNIYSSYSDDRAHSWSPMKPISGSAQFCEGLFGDNSCDDNTFSTPTVSPVTGFVYVAFENFNTPAEDQYLVVRSTDGGNTWQGPFFVTYVYDINYPKSGTGPTRRNDCAARGQQSGRNVLSNSCFRVNAGGNMVVDKRGGDFANDLYLVMSDNRNGTRASTNTDVFLYKSIDGGTTWIGPTRVNNDPSSQPTITVNGQQVSNRNCALADTSAACAGSFGNDQWYPWVDISQRGDVNVVFEDRRLDTSSTAGEWPTSRIPPNGRPGNYLVWFWGAVCSVTTPDSTQCTAPTASTITQPTAPSQPGNALLPEQTVFPFRNFQLSDVPSNWDYSFRAGIFAGDYSGLNIGPDNQAWPFWTDARNGRSSRTESGRNPSCEQSDVFTDPYSSQSGGQPGNAQQSDSLFLVTPCPTPDSDTGAGNNGGGQ